MKKKLRFVITLFLMSFFLTSCQVHWFDESFDVPWWMVAVPVVIFTLSVWIAAGKFIASQKFVCPECNKTFYPVWWKAAVSVHMGDSRVLKCPHCGYKGFCPESRE